MKQSTFLIESLKRTLDELASVSLTTEEQTQLSELSATTDFIKLFNVPEEQAKQLTERELSAITEYRWNTVYAGFDLCNGHNWGVNKDGAVTVRERQSFINTIVFRLMEAGDKLTAQGTHEAIFRIVDKETREVSTVHFEVPYKHTASTLFGMIKSYLPARYNITVKKM